ncbi:echinoidin-like isoform X2 [Lytechinus pictus]|uniref:echinoidin-like isoform X2 n=1 Tax=Lytechinus pictus TaxID=7653 RepID=UPI0030BA09C1
MVQTIPKLIPYTTFTKGVAYPRRDRPRASGSTPGHLVCRFPASKKSITTISSNETTLYPAASLLKHATCPLESWTSFQGCCYIFVDTPLIFEEALSFCRNLTNEPSCPVDLISIHSPEENDLAHKLSVNSTGSDHTWFWIGLYQPEPDSDFVWSDGTQLDFTSWIPSEPNNARSSEDCVLSHFRASVGPAWYDMDCDVSSPFICKHPVLCQSTSTQFP